MECINENYFHIFSIPNTHKNVNTYRKKHPFHTFYDIGGFNPLFVCTHFHTTLPFQAPFPHADFDKLVTPLFPQAAPWGMTAGTKNLIESQLDRKILLTKAKSSYFDKFSMVSNHLLQVNCNLNSSVCFEDWSHDGKGTSKVVWAQADGGGRPSGVPR